jgi:hypothetical protein
MKRSGPSHLLRLPFSGRLLICTDLHGHLADFRRMRDVFLLCLRQEEDPFLLFTGDLIHGPNCTPEEWPEHMGERYEDQSGALLDEFIRLQSDFPTRVACLLGNHEHSHVGGPHTPKFWPDETLYFEQSVGPKRAERYNRLFKQFFAAAVASCGVAVTHAAPNVEVSGPEEIEGIRYEGFEHLEVFSMSEMPLLGGLLWSRSCSPLVAQRFLAALSKNGPSLHVVIYGHEIVPQGFEHVGDEQLVLSTSFGIPREYRTYLKLDLRARYRSANDFEAGRELLLLYP